MATWLESSTESLVCARLYCVTTPLDAHLPDWYKVQVPSTPPQNTTEERENTPPANSSEMETKFCGSTNDHGDTCCVCPRCNSSFTGRSRANAFINTSRNFQALDLQLVLCSNQVNAKRAALMRKRTRKSQKPKLLSGWND